MEKFDLLKLLPYIPPGSLSYQEWLNVGMALKQEGFRPEDWDAWSRSDKRYKPGECLRKWNGFNGAGTPVTGATITQLAKENGWNPKENAHELDWNDVIEKDEHIIVDKNWIEEKEIQEPVNWDPKRELIRYIETLYDSTELVGYVTHSYEKDGKYLPDKGLFDRTAGQLIQLLVKSKDICEVVGDYKKEAGAWIRFNPLDGKGVKNENVTEYKYALVESDELEIEKQNALVRELELPVACLVHSGGKSLHAVVRVDASDYQEYRQRVDYLYNVCSKNGLKVDQANRNPSRLSRMPGVIRNGKKQFIVDTNIGKASWNEWYEWIEGINDDLPEPENLSSVWDCLPDLSEPLIENVLRKGHKMLLAGPSKAGKSFALIELCISIAEGRKWLGFHCAKGKVLYVNLELDRASCLHRFKDVYEKSYAPQNIKNVDIWNLRGKSIPMDKLAPKLIRRAAKKDYVAIVIDPIYKVITGDENSADQMAAFCNQFDKVCTELGCAVIYCHHHSKGSQGSKRSMDRASGYGVFARDPDALLDLIELELTKEIYEQQVNQSTCLACTDVLNEFFDDWEDDVSQDDMCSQFRMLEYCKKKLSTSQYAHLENQISKAKEKEKTKTAWRVEGTLREFPKFDPVDVWFDYPIHKVDQTGALSDIAPESVLVPWKKGAINNQKNVEKRQKAGDIAFENAVLNCNFGAPPTLSDVAEMLGVSIKTARRRMYANGNYFIEKSDNTIRKKIHAENTE
ncbi:MAG: AAA family ATPase [Lachnospiraceae bacterium]|jgi:RecA-family ATPase|nr:AAA family ATPase [Lachnospiraceae bacterium]